MKNRYECCHEVTGLIRITDRTTGRAAWYERTGEYVSGQLGPDALQEYLAGAEIIGTPGYWRVDGVDWPVPESDRAADLAELVEIAG